MACALLAENSLLILDRNVRYPDGEIDIVALDGGTTVFVSNVASIQVTASIVRK